MLYNLIEATITKLIKEITNEINNNSVAYIDLIDNVKKAWIKIHCRAPLLECKKRISLQKCMNIWRKLLIRQQ